MGRLACLLGPGPETPSSGAEMTSGASPTQGGRLLTELIDLFISIVTLTRRWCSWKWNWSRDRREPPLPPSYVNTPVPIAYAS